jgi:hypothetical protein
LLVLAYMLAGAAALVYVSMLTYASMAMVQLCWRLSLLGQLAILFA